MDSGKGVYQGAVFDAQERPRTLVDDVRQEHYGHREACLTHTRTNAHTHNG